MFKRRISTEQLAELTEEQKQKLRELWKCEYGDVFYIEQYKDNPEAQIQAMDKSWQLIVKDKKGYLPLLDIGQMIELLHDKVNVSFFDRKPGPVWSVMKDNIWYDAPELADALWQAVKQVLGV